MIAAAARPETGDRRFLARQGCVPTSFVAAGSQIWRESKRVAPTIASLRCVMADTEGRTATQQNAGRGRTTAVIPAAAPHTVRNSAKDRLIAGGLVLAALPCVVWSVPRIHEALEASLNLGPRAHVTLEAWLNLLWALLAVVAFLQWVAPEGRKRHIQLSGLVNLVFALTLLFPVISANDDLAELDLINDAKTAQSVTASFKSDKHQPDPAGLLGPPAASASGSSSAVPLTSESVSEPAGGASVATPGDTTGNHSPPLC